jgi:hypothetical protein
LDGKIEKQGDRTDRLYEIYVTTQKDIYDLRADFNEKYYQLLGKEMK